MNSMETKSTASLNLIAVARSQALKAFLEVAEGKASVLTPRYLSSVRENALRARKEMNEAWALFSLAKTQLDHRLQFYSNKEVTFDSLAETGREETAAPGVSIWSHTADLWLKSYEAHAEAL